MKIEASVYTKLVLTKLKNVWTIFVLYSNLLSVIENSRFFVNFPIGLIKKLFEDSFNPFLLQPTVLVSRDCFRDSTKHLCYFAAKQNFVNFGFHFAFFRQVFREVLIRKGYDLYNCNVPKDLISFNEPVRGQ